MGLFKVKQPNDNFDFSKSFKDAFQFGEGDDTSTRKKAIDLYATIIKNNPTCYEALFNLGVIQKRNGQWQSAIESFSKAEKSPELAIVASYARLKSLAENGIQLEESDFPANFRGNNRGALGVQGPCHNAANELRNRGYPCTIEAHGERASIILMSGNTKYIITVYDLEGMLIKNLSREEGTSTNLGDVNDLSEIELMLKRLEIGHLSLTQVCIPKYIDGTGYSKLQTNARKITGPHGWQREGLSIEERIQRNIKDAPPGVKLIQTLSIEDIAKANNDPGGFMACVLEGEPRVITVINETRSDHIATIKRCVENGACIFRDEFFSMPEYPIVHIGLGIALEYLSRDRVSLLILENLTNFMDANLQDWVSEIENKKYTLVHVFDSNYKIIATGRTFLDNEISSHIINSYNQANKSIQKIPSMTLNYNKAKEKFCEQYPDPFIWSSKL